MNFLLSAETFQKELAGLRRNHSRSSLTQGEKISLLIGLHSLLSQKLGWRDNQSNVWQKLPHAPWLQIGLWGCAVAPHNKGMLMAFAQ